MNILFRFDPPGETCAFPVGDRSTFNGTITFAFDKPQSKIYEREVPGWAFWVSVTESRGMAFHRSSLN